MSYHVQQSSQQKSLGIIVVIAFHVVLIFALITGLKVGIFITPPDSITVDTITEKPIPVTPVDEPKVNFNEKTNIVIPVIPHQIIDSDPPITDKTRPILPGGEIGVATTTISKPSLKNPTTPTYPAASVRLNEEGTTGLNLYITADGRVSEASVFSSSGYSRLDEAAVKHAQRYWKFSPCVENGTAIGCWFQTKLVWRLEDAAKH